MQNLVFISDRGGHWHNAIMLINQLGFRPKTILTTQGPEIPQLKNDFDQVIVLPTLFTFWGKMRIINPFKVFLNLVLSIYWAIRIKPLSVVSLGAANVVFFCYASKLLGAKLYHVECMNQVVNPSITGRLLYPACDTLFVQWPELLKCYGSKALYKGWVI